MGLQRSSFPDLGLLGDSVFVYDMEKQLELQDQHTEIWLQEYKKKKKAHIREIVDASMYTEKEIEWMENYPSQFPADGMESRYAERIIMPNFFDMRRNSYVMKD